MEQTRFISRCRQKETALLKPDAHHREVIRNSLGWLHVAEKMEDHLDTLSAFAEEARRAGFRRVVHMGMGGSSLAPLVFQQTCLPETRGLPLTVLDTTDPATVLKIEREGLLPDTLFIVAPTDPGTPLVKQAEERKLRKIFLNFPDIGGRYSVLIILRPRARSAGLCVTSRTSGQPTELIEKFGISAGRIVTTVKSALRSPAYS